jgi:hypothetical protein
VVNVVLVYSQKWRCDITLAGEVIAAHLSAIYRGSVLIADFATVRLGQSQFPGAMFDWSNPSIPVTLSGPTALTEGDTLTMDLIDTLKGQGVGISKSGETPVEYDLNVHKHRIQEFNDQSALTFA